LRVSKKLTESMYVFAEPFPSYGIVIIVLGLLLMMVSISAVFVYR